MRIGASCCRGQGIDGIDQSGKFKTVQDLEHANGNITYGWERDSSPDGKSRHESDDAGYFLATGDEEWAHQLEIIGDGRRFHRSRPTAGTDQP